MTTDELYVYLTEEAQRLLPIPPAPVVELVESPHGEVTHIRATYYTRELRTEFLVEVRTEVT